MNMQLIKLELAMLIRERRVLWLLLGVAALILLSFMLVALETANANAAKYSTARAERERWLNQDQKDPHSAAHHSIFAFKPAPALATLDLASSHSWGNPSGSKRMHRTTCCTDQRVRQGRCSVLGW